MGLPIALGGSPVPGSAVRATFYVLDCPEYHWILGLTLLTTIDGAVFCRTGLLQYTLGPAGEGQTVQLPLMPRTAVHR